MLNRTTFLFALLGMIVALHLWIQKERNFDHGCWGLGETNAPLALEGCRDPALQRFSTLFGVSTAGLGFVFFATVATLSFGKSVLKENAARICHTVSEFLCAGAACYAAFLTYYQIGVARTYCPLCLVLSTLIFVLAAIHLSQRFGRGFVPVSEDRRFNELASVAMMSFGGIALAAIPLLIAGNVGAGARPSSKPAPRLVASDWVRPDNAVLGTRGGASIVAFLDPNCPHCKDVYATIEQLAKEYERDASFAVIPRVLWQRSMLQGQALELAAKQGKYYDLWRLQFEKRKPEGMGLDDLKELMASLQLETGDLKANLDAEKDAVAELRSKASKAGITSTPTVFVNGVLVPTRECTHDGLARLIAPSDKKRTARR
jgi:uncharacterized membrane protein/thiol-disulfide isomerase/thioredoxin